MGLIEPNSQVWQYTVGPKRICSLQVNAGRASALCLLLWSLFSRGRGLPYLEHLCAKSSAQCGSPSAPADLDLGNRPTEASTVLPCCLPWGPTDSKSATRWTFERRSTAFSDSARLTERGKKLHSIGHFPVLIVEVIFFIFGGFGLFVSVFLYILYIL